MSEIRICKYCGMELSEDIPHGLRECHLRAVARIAELEALVQQLVWVGNDLLTDNTNPVTIILFKGLVTKSQLEVQE